MSNTLPFRAAMVMQLESNPGPRGADNMYVVGVLSIRIFTCCCGGGTRELLRKLSEDESAAGGVETEGAMGGERLVVSF